MPRPSHKIIFVFLLLFALLLNIPIPAAAESTPVTLKLWGGNWGVPSRDKTDPWSRAGRAVFERFQVLHPNIRLVNVSGLEIQGPAAESNLLMAMAGGTAPDVFYVNFRQLNSYVSQNFLYPLNDYIKQDPDVYNSVHPVVKKVITIDGKVYCIPWYQAVQALYYRKDLFKAAGLDPNKPPQTWDEFYNYAQKLTIPEKGQYGFVWPGTPQGTSYWWVNFLWQAGGDVVAQDQDGNWRAIFNSPAGVTALKFYRKLLLGEWVRPSDGRHIRGVATRTPLFKEQINKGNIGMWFAYTTDVATNRSDMNPSLVGIATMPAGPAGRANEINAGMWGMNSQIKDKRVRDAAWEYIKFMSSEEADRVRTTAYVEAGLGKLVNPDKLEKYGYTEYLRGIPKAWIAANKEAFKHGHPEPHGKNCEMIYTELDQPLEAIGLHPDADPKQLLDACARKIDAKMLGYVPPKVMHKNRTIAWSVFAFILFGAVGVSSWQLQRALSARAARRRSGVIPGRGKWVHIIAWLFMLPAVLSILVWNYYPLLRGMVMAFQDYRILGNSRFVGLDNFIEAFSHDTFWFGVGNSLLYAALNLTLGFLVPIILAIMLNEIPRAKMFFRTVYYLPTAMSGLVMMFLWKWFYDPTPAGLFNTLIGYYNDMAVTLAQNIHPILAHLQLSQQTWLQDPKLAMTTSHLPRRSGHFLVCGAGRP